MQLHIPPADRPARPAATVVILRDAPQGLEVFLVKRHGLSDVLGGAYVFPGGKVDESDAQLDMALHLDSEPSALRTRLGEPALGEHEAAGLFVAAIREAFEETGVLLAHGAGAAESGQAWQLLREGQAFNEVAARMALRLDAVGLAPWSRWITPVVSSVTRKRFDTRFFVAAMPAGQHARHDGHEAVDSAWLRPGVALARYDGQEIQLAPPQIMSLSHLARHGSVQGVLDEARGRRPPLIQPEAFDQEDGRVICYPGDERHSVRDRVFDGPTRLHYRGGRFEAEGGLAALLG